MANLSALDEQHPPIPGSASAASAAGTSTSSGESANKNVSMPIPLPSSRSPLGAPISGSSSTSSSSALANTVSAPIPTSSFAAPMSTPTSLSLSISPSPAPTGMALARLPAHPGPSNLAPPDQHLLPHQHAHPHISPSTGVTPQQIQGAFSPASASKQVNQHHANADGIGHDSGAGFGLAADVDMGTGTGTGNGAEGATQNADGQMGITPIPRATPTNKNNPAFLNKLRSMVDAPETDELIRWSPAGDSFFVPNHVRFGDEVLPRFFKHNRFSSFVRQLNMYGFHKVPHLQQGVLKHDLGSEMELWEFTNPNFHRDRPDLLSKVQRKRATKEGENAEGGPSKPEEVVKNGALMRGEQGENGAQAGTMQLANVWSAIQAIKRAQSNIHTDLQHLQTSNQHLWQEAIESRRRSKKQQETINKMLRFLAGVFGTAEVNDRGTHAPNGHPSGGRRVAVRPRKKDRLMIADASMEETPDDTEGEIEELELPLDEEEEIEELPTHGRFSEARSASEQSPRASSPFGSNPRFTHVGSPSTGTHALPNLPSETTSTPGGSRRISQQTSNQILNALASSEGNAWLASIFGGGAANAGSSRPTTPGGGLRLDAQTVAALQSAMASGSGSGSGGGSRAGPSSSSGNAGGLNGSADYFSAEDEMEEPRFAYPYPPFGASSNANGDNMGSTAASSSSPSSGAVPAPAANSAATSWPGVQTTSGTSAAPNMAPSDAVRFAQQHRTGPASAFSQALVHSPSPARPGAAGVSSSSAPSFSTGAGAPGPSGMGLMLAPNASGQPSTSAGNSASAAHAQAQNQMLSALSLARATQDLSSTSNDAGMVQNSINMLIESLKLDPNALGLLNQAGLGLGQGQQGHHGQPGQQGQQGAQAPATGSGMGMGMGMGMALPTTPRGQSQNRLNGIHDSTFGGVNNSGGQGTSAFGGANTGSGSGSGIGAGLGTATASGFSDAQQHSQPSQGFAADFDMDSFLSQFVDPSASANSPLGFSAPSPGPVSGSLSGSGSGSGSGTGSGSTSAPSFAFSPASSAAFVQPLERSTEGTGTGTEDSGLVSGTGTGTGVGTATGTGTGPSTRNTSKNGSAVNSAESSAASTPVVGSWGIDIPGASAGASTSTSTTTGASNVNVNTNAPPSAETPPTGTTGQTMTRGRKRKSSEFEGALGADIQRANAIVGAGVNGGAGAGAGAGAKVDGADVGARAGAERPKVPKMTVIQDEEG